MVHRRSQVLFPSTSSRPNAQISKREALIRFLPVFPCHSVPTRFHPGSTSEISHSDTRDWVFPSRGRMQGDHWTVSLAFHALRGSKGASYLSSMSPFRLPVPMVGQLSIHNHQSDCSMDMSIAIISFTFPWDTHSSNKKYKPATPVTPTLVEQQHGHTNPSQPPRCRLSTIGHQENKKITLIFCMPMVP
jgi:hypothetical protein